MKETSATCSGTAAEWMRNERDRSASPSGSRSRNAPATNGTATKKSARRSDGESPANQAKPTTAASEKKRPALRPKIPPAALAAPPKSDMCIPESARI